MFNMTMVQSQYCIIAALGGITVTILLILGYLAMWTPRIRKDGKYEGYNGGWKMIWNYHPWVILIIYLGIIVFEIWFLVYFAINPPNW